MTTTNQTKLTPRLTARLSTYTAVTGAALAVTAATLPNSEAAIVYVDPTNIPVPQTSAGVYIDLVTGQTSAAPFTGYDINPYGSTSLLFFAGTGTGYVAPTTAGPASALPGGAFIGLSDVFTTSSAGTNFQVTGTEFLGLRFTNTTTGALNYGWVEFTTMATTGYPATVNRWAFENAGGSILAGQTAVPEPTTTALLGLGAMSLGAAGVRRWRKAKPAVV